MLDKILYLLGLGEVTAKCGHKTKVSEKIEVINEKGQIEIVTIENVMNPNICNNCLVKAITRCAWCGGYILPGYPTTLYIPAEGFITPNYAVAWNKDPNYLIGCYRDGCYRNKHDYAGELGETRGEIKRIAAPISWEFFKENKKTALKYDKKRSKSIED